MRLFSCANLGLIIIVSLNAICAQNCANPVTRKEIRELTQQEFTNYTTAIQKLHSSTAFLATVSEYESFSKLHYTSSSMIHGHPSFLPWHREFLFKYEQALKKINPKVVLPYWDWTNDYEYPDESIVLTEYMMGGNGDESNNYCLSDGPFKSFIMKYPTTSPQHCLRRQYDEGDTISSFVSPETIVAVSSDKRFSYFSYLFEIYHGYPHVGVGGSSGDFSKMYSPNDPLFYLHHCFIDMVFSKWQDKFGLSIPYEGTRYRKTVSSADTLYNLSIKVRDAWNTRSTRYCYQYPSYPRVIPNPSYLQNATLSTNSLPKRKDLDMLDMLDHPFKMGKKFNKKLSKALDNLKENHKQRIGGLLEKNPFFFGEEEYDNNEFEGKDIKSLISHVKSKYKSKNGKKAKKRGRRPKRLPSDWSSKNGFTEEEIEEAYKIANELLDALYDIDDFISIGDVHV